jgi:polyhydroxyalkanoate synthesis regulator protein
VTLKDIAVQVGLGRNVQVIEAKTGDEITGSILLRAIVEYEVDELNSKAPMFVDIIKAGGIANYVDKVKTPIYG